MGAVDLREWQELHVSQWAKQRQLDPTLRQFLLNNKVDGRMLSLPLDALHHELTQLGCAMDSHEFRFLLKEIKLLQEQANQAKLGEAISCFFMQFS